MGLNVTNPPSTTFIPYQQKSIYALASSGGWTAGDYVYVGPGASGAGFFRPDTTAFPISTMVNQGIPTIASSQTSATRAGCYGPSLLYTTYTGTTQTPDVAAGTQSTIYTGTGYYGFTAFTLTNGSYVVGSTGVYPYAGYGTLFNSSNTTITSFATDYTTSYYYVLPGSCGAALSTGGFIYPSFNDSQQTIIKEYNSTGSNVRNIVAASGFNPSGGVSCIGFSNGFYGIVWSRSGVGYGNIYNTSGTLVYSFNTPSANYNYGARATSIGTKAIIVFPTNLGAGTKTFILDAVALSYSEGPSLGFAYTPNAYYAIRATTLTNGNALFVGRNNNGNSINYSIITPQLSVSSGSLSLTSDIYAADELGGLTYLPGGGFAVAWLDSANGRFKYLRYSESAGLLSSSATNLATTLNTGGNDNGAITALTSGEIIGGYQGTSSYSYYTQRFSTGSLVQNVSVLSGTTFSPNNGYTLMGVAATTTTAGNYGEVVVGGAATLSASYPSLVSQVSFDYAGTATTGSQANAGSVLARNVSLQGF